MTAWAMSAFAIVALLLAADPSDEAFLVERVKELRKRYDDQVRKQSAPAIRQRAAVVREVAHLPHQGKSRDAAGRLLARIVQTDRAYRVRADAARAIGRVGTARALQAMYLALFGSEGRSRRFELIQVVLPEALSTLRHPDDLDWISEKVLRPAAAGRSSFVLTAAGPMRERMVVLTLDGVGRARARALGSEVGALAGSKSAAVRVAAVRALVTLDLGDEIIRKAARETEEELRAAAAEFPRLPLGDARRSLAFDSELVRRAAIRGCAKRPPKEAIPLLIERFEEETGSLALELAETLNVLTGKEFGGDALRWKSWWEVNAERFVKPGEREQTGRVYFFDVGLRTKRVLFLIDVSSSMRRTDERGVSRQQRAVQELRSTLSKLPPKSTFALMTFAAEIRRFPDRGAEFREGAKDAVAWLSERKPAGATNTYGALMRAFEDPLQPDTVVLLSDGNPYRCSYRGKTYSEHEQILAEVRRANGRRFVRIHTVALLSGTRTNQKDEDPQTAAEFLRRLAADNGGDFREVR